MTTRRLRSDLVVTRRRPVALLGAVVLVAGTLVSCGGVTSSRAPEVDPGAPVTSAAASQDPGDPGDDGGDDGGNDGVDDAGDDGGAPSISLPQLPIGGDAQVVGGTDLQCVNVSWIVTEDGPGALVAGYAVAIDTIVVPAPFAVADSGCSDGPPTCVGYTFTADSQSPACQAAITLVRPFYGFEEGASTALTIEGTLVCGTAAAPVPEADCEAFRAGAESSPQQSIDLSTDFGPDPSAAPSESTEPAAGG